MIMAIGISLETAAGGEHGVAKPEWGTKRSCLSCGARFYDLQRESVACPACGAAFDPAASGKPRRVRAAHKPAAAVGPVVSAPADQTRSKEVDDDEVEVTKVKKAPVAKDDESDDEDGESAIEDVSELGDDDVADVIDTELDDEDSER